MIMPPPLFLGGGGLCLQLTLGGKSAASVNFGSNGGAGRAVTLGSTATAAHWCFRGFLGTARTALGTAVTKQLLSCLSD